MNRFAPSGNSVKELLVELESLRDHVGCTGSFCLFQKDRDGRLLWVNDEYLRAVGRSSAEIVGRTDFDLFPATFAQKYRDDDQRVLSEGKPFHTFEGFQAPDGSKRFIYVSKVPYRDVNENIVGILGGFQYAPARSDVEARLHENEERLRHILDRLPVLMSALDGRGRIVYWNRECERVTGYTAAEICGNPDAMATLYPDEHYRQSMIEKWKRGAGPTRDWDWKLTCKDGSRRTIAWSNISSSDPVTGWDSWGLGVDVTEKSQMLEMLDAVRQVHHGHIIKTPSAELFAQLLKHLLSVTNSEYGFIGEVLHQPRGRRYLKMHAITNIAWNEETRALYEKQLPTGTEFNNLETLFGAVIDSGEVVISNDPSNDPRRGGLPPGHPELRAFIGIPLFHEEGLIGVAGLANRPRGYDRGVMDSVSPLLSTCEAIIHSYRADRERLRQENERRQLETQLQYAQKLESLGVLAGGIAHDFNNLLVSVLGHASLALQDIAATSPAHESVRQIEIAAMRAADLCKQMLAYSGKGRFVIQRIHLSSLVEEMADLLKVSISKKIVLRYNLAKNLPPIEADATQIRQIVMNLMTNASEACGDASGQISISTGVMDVDREYLQTTFIHEDLTEGPYVFIEVSDTGCGMDEETRARIFDPFFTTKATGRGLGMAAVLGIVRGHRGAIKSYSEPSRGTTFKVLFPAVAGEAERLQEKKPVQDFHGSGTILIVDDEEGVRNLARHSVERHGFKVLTAKDGREGVEMYRQFQDEIVLVLLDMMMPYLNGEEVFRELRKLREDVRVILSSGYNEQEATNRFVGKGLAGFIQKPYRPSELIEMIASKLAPTS